MLRDAEAGSPVNRVQDREYPPRDQLSYENYLVAILGGEVDCFFNFAFKNAGASAYPSQALIRDTRIRPVGSEVRSINYLHNDAGRFLGVQLFDRDRRMLL